MFAFFERLIDPFPAQHPEQPPTGLYQFCRHYTRGIEPYLILMAVLTATVSVSETLLFSILGQLVDWFAENDPSTFLDENSKTLLGLSLFVLVFIPCVAALHSLVIYQTLMGNFPMAVRWLAHRYLLNQSYTFFQNEFSGRVAAKVMQTALAVRESVMKLLDVILFISVYMIMAMVLVARVDWRLCIPFVVWLLLYIQVQRRFIPRLKRISARQADARALMTGRIVDSYTNIVTLKLFSHSARESDYTRQGMTEFIDTVYPQMRLVTLLHIWLWALNMGLVFAVSGAGIYLWLQYTITPGAIAVAISLAIRLTGMSHWIMWELAALFENIGTVQDGMNTLAVPQAIVDEEDAIDLVVHRGSIRFRDVHFAYQANETVFDGFNLAIASGERLGIVGRSGAGKSTLVNLLLRFYDVQAGMITIDDQNIRHVRQESLRANIAMVTQDTSLLHRSVRENILFGRPDATEEQLLNAARKAQAHDFILNLRDHKGRTGYDAHVGERGVALSGGQRQRIAIARVLLKDAPILVLDEATSALDSEVESTIRDNLYQLMAGKTVIAIAHRLSTIAALDRLIVLDQGKLVEQGTHEELLKAAGIYAQLWRHQSGGFLGAS